MQMRNKLMMYNALKVRGFSQQSKINETNMISYNMNPTKFLIMVFEILDINLIDMIDFYELLNNDMSLI